MFWTIKFWVREWIAKRFEGLPDCFHYWFTEKYLREQVQRGNANYFRALIESYEEGAQ